jgi:vanillate monooxygenase ferredoxin subunit
MSNAVSMLELKIRKKKMEALDVCSFELVSQDGSDLPTFSAGAHIDVFLPNGLIRQYSLYGNPQDKKVYKIAVLKEPQSRGGSQALHEFLQEGDLLKVSAPRNHFALSGSAKRSLLLAGGIGITPILSMAESLSNSGAEFELHYSAKTPEQAAFLNYIRGSCFSSVAHCYFSKHAGSQALDIQKVLSQVDSSCHVYICGPKGFIDVALEVARKSGWSADQIHYELFGAEIIKSDGDQVFDVKLASSGRIISVATDQTVVEALAKAGVDILVSCEQGVCGTCITGVIEGIPDHKDSYFTAEEHALNNQFTPCCSRSKTPLLVLDL